MNSNLIKFNLIDTKDGDYVPVRLLLDFDPDDMNDPAAQISHSMNVEYLQELDALQKRIKEKYGKILEELSSPEDVTIPTFDGSIYDYDHLFYT